VVLEGHTSLSLLFICVDRFLSVTLVLFYIKY